MKIQYEYGPAIEVTPKMVKAVKDFALEVMAAMQQADKGNADCWTACQIDFQGIQPRFMWGSDGDMPDSKNAITVHNVPAKPPFAEK